MTQPYQIHEFGALSTWGDNVGGLSPLTTMTGRRFLEKDLALDYFGVSINARQPGESVHYWHSHSVLEELYLFLEGEGEMALDGEVVPVKAGSAVRVAQGVMRAWRATPQSPVPLRWICIRAGGAKLAEIGKDGTLAQAQDKALPWG